MDPLLQERRSRNFLFDQARYASEFMTDRNRRSSFFKRCDSFCRQGPFNFEVQHTNGIKALSLRGCLKKN